MAADGRADLAGDGGEIRKAHFTTIPRSHTFNAPTHDDHVLFENISKLFTKAYRDRVPVRLVGVALTHLTEQRLAQMDLFAA